MMLVCIILMMTLIKREDIALTGSTYTISGNHDRDEEEHDDSLEAEQEDYQHQIEHQ